MGGNVTFIVVASNALAGLGLLLIAWMVLGDTLLRWRRGLLGRPRCPRCWYDMSGAPDLTCPECGRTARSPRKLRRTRRRWVWIAPGLFLLFVASQIREYPHRRYEPKLWTRFVPTTALVVLTNVAREEHPQWAADTLSVRDFRAAGWQKWFSARLDAWHVSEDDLRQVQVYSRDVWPSGSRVRLSVGGYPTRLSPLVGERSLIVRPGEFGDSIGRRATPPFWTSRKIQDDLPDSCVLQGLAPGRHEIPLTIEFSDRWGVLRSAASVLTLEIAPPGTPVLAPVVDPRVVPTVRAALRVDKIYQARDAAPRLEFTVDRSRIWDDLQSQRPSTTSLGLRATFLDGERVLAVLQGDMFDAILRGDRQALEAFVLEPVGTSWGLAWNTDQLNNVLVRLQADEAEAAASLNADKYWDFDFTVPLSEIAAESARRRRPD